MYASSARGRGAVGKTDLAHLDTSEQSGDSPRADGELERCGWCGLQPLALDLDTFLRTELCAACFHIVGDVNWKSHICGEGNNFE